MENQPVALYTKRFSPTNFFEIGGCQWLSVAVDVCRWLSVAVGGCRWLSVAVGGCRWLSVAVGVKVDLTHSSTSGSAVVSRC